MKIISGKNNDFEKTDNTDNELKVLIVEDSFIDMKLIEITLKRFTKNILSAINGYEAVKICQNNPDIDLILMDIHIPFINGIEATSLIRKFNTNVVIIATTSLVYSEKEFTKTAGFNDYIFKPYRKDQIADLINNFYIKYKTI